MSAVDPVLKPGLLHAIAVIRKFKTDYRLSHDTRKRFDLPSMQRVVDQGMDFLIEDIEAEAGLREKWDPTQPPEGQPDAHPHREQGQSAGGDDGCATVDPEDLWIEPHGKVNLQRSRHLKRPTTTSEQEDGRHGEC